MPFTWKDTMRNASDNPALEQMTRGAVIVAIGHLSAVMGERPRWNGSAVLVPQNPAADKMAVAIGEPISTEVVGLERERIIARAVRLAESVCRVGQPADAAFAELEKKLAKPVPPAAK